MTRSVTKSLRVAEQYNVNLHSLAQNSTSRHREEFEPLQINSQKCGSKLQGDEEDDGLAVAPPPNFHNTTPTGGSLSLLHRPQTPGLQCP
ncbi:hypothetical protein TNCV_5059211 [Trichonephila clavipes]|nr:hypothetical protein TNCV_5059211 [Trichonephila clavipes]